MTWRGNPPPFSRLSSRWNSFPLPPLPFFLSVASSPRPCTYDHSKGGIAAVAVIVLFLHGFPVVIFPLLALVFPASFSPRNFLPPQRLGRSRSVGKRSLAFDSETRRPFSPLAETVVPVRSLPLLLFPRVFSFQCSPTGCRTAKSVL